MSETGDAWLRLERSMGVNWTVEHPKPLQDLIDSLKRLQESRLPLRAINELSILLEAHKAHVKSQG